MSGKQLTTKVAAITKTDRTLLHSLYLNINMSVSVHVFYSLEKEAEKAEEDLGSMVRSAYRPASQ